MTLSLSLAALAKAQESIGQGETRENNSSPFLDRIREETGLGKDGGAWCAVWVSWCFQQAVYGPLPFRMSAVAKALTRNIAKAGRYIDTPEPGAVICWDRPPLPWMGHVGFVERYDPAGLTPVGRRAGKPHGAVLCTLEGNKGPHPSLVKRYYYSAAEWQRRLYRIAIL